MAYRDYIHCSECDCKLIYDGYDSIRETLEEKYNTTSLICPDCLRVKTETIESLMKTNVFLSKLLSKQSNTESNFAVNMIPISSPEFRAEIWVDGNKTQVYTGQDAIDVELGKIPVPKNAKIKVIDV